MSLSRIKSLAKDSVIYGLSGIITRLITVFLVPVYTRIFSPEDYGTLNLINTTFGFVGMFAIFGLDSSAGRWFYDTTDEKDRKTTFASWFWFQLTVSLLFALMLIVCTPLVSRRLLELPLSTTWIIWILPCITLIANILPGIIWNWYRLNRRPVATVVFTLGQSLLTVSLTLLLVVGLKLGLKGVFLSLLISGTIFSCIAMVQMKSWISPRYFRVARLKEMLRFALPLIPAALAFWTLNATDAYFLLYLKDKAEVGLFSIGAALASGVALITGAFQQAWGPFAFSIINEPDAKKTYASVFYVFGMVSSMVIFGMFLFSEEALMLLTTEQYYQSSWVASILSINVVLMAFSYIASIGTNIAKDNKPYAIGIFMACIATIILDILLIPHFGKEGSAIATVLAQILVPAYIFYRAQKLYFIPFKFGSVILMLLLAIGMGTIAKLFVWDMKMLYIILAKIFIFVVYLCILCMISKKYLQVIIQKIKSRKVTKAPVTDSEPEL